MDNQNPTQSPTPSGNLSNTFQSQQALDLTNRAKSGANWFFWIAGLSIINSLIYISGMTLTFVVGLGATQMVDGIMEGLAELVESDSLLVFRLIGLFIDVIIAGVFILFGVLGRKQIRWAMIVGIVLYSLDALLFLWVQYWFGFVFHLLALYYLFRGWQAMGELAKLRQNQAAANVPPIST